VDVDEHQDQDENPLEDAAAEMSEGLHGTSVEVEQTSKNRVQGGQVRMVDSVAKTVSASALHMEESAAGYVRSGSVDVMEGAVGVAVASAMSLRESTNVLAIARTLDASDVRALVVLAPRVNGTLQTVFTPLTALAAGAGLALGLALIPRTLAWLVKRLFRRRA
jgi:hypothetical protein